MKQLTKSQDILWYLSHLQTVNTTSSLSVQVLQFYHKKENTGTYISSLFQIKKLGYVYD